MKKTVVKSTLKRILVLFLTFLMLASSFVSLLAYADIDLDSQIKNKINLTYSVIRAKRGSSYDGYCGTFIRDQLNALNVGFVNLGGYNGNQWYPNLVADAKTVYGYTQKKYPGNSCLYDIVDDRGNEVYNIVISFHHQYGYTDAKPGAGHAVFIYAIVNGIVYFSESYSNSTAREGSPITMSIDSFYKKYNSSYGNALGAVYFESEIKSDKNDNEGPSAPGSSDKTDLYGIYYEIKNLASGKYLNIYGSKNSEGTYVNIYSRDYTTGEKFRIEPFGDAFRIYPLCAPTRAVNMVSSKGQLNVPKDGNENDLWYLESIGGNQYIIRYKLNPDYVLTASGSSNSSRVVLSEYSSTNKNQIWEFSLNSISEAAKMYTVTWDIDGKLYKDYYSYNQVPTCSVIPEKQDAEFIGWDKEITNVKNNVTYTAQFETDGSEYSVTWIFGGVEYTEIFYKGEIPEFTTLPEISAGKPDYVMYDKQPTPVYENGDRYTVYYVYEDSYGAKYHDGKDYLRGWNTVSGGKRYFTKYECYMITESTTIAGVSYKINNDGSLFNGLYDIGDETRYYIDGIIQRGWHEIDGKLYYFFSSTGYMVKESTYTIGGLLRVFNEDHSVQPINGWQTKNGYKYYYVNGEMVTGWKIIDGETYYFLRSDDVFGQMASGWQKIGGVFYYFYAYGSDNYGQMVTADRTIGGTWHEFDTDGTLLTGFCYNNGNTYYMLNGKLASGWQKINGEYYYFLLESGLMVTESRAIGGVWYEFDENGVCLNK